MTSVPREKILSKLSSLFSLPTFAVALVHGKTPYVSSFRSSASRVEVNVDMISRKEEALAFEVFDEAVSFENLNTEGLRRRL